MKNLFGLLCLGLAFWINALPTQSETIILRPVVNEYRVAESLGCQEVSNVCRQHKRQDRIFKARTK